MCAAVRLPVSVDFACLSIELVLLGFEPVKDFLVFGFFSDMTVSCAFGMVALTAAPTASGSFGRGLLEFSKEPLPSGLPDP